MDDLQLYIYIALAAIYFLSRAFIGKKPAKSPRNSPNSDPNRDQNESQKSSGRPITFEDLLKEFTSQKGEKEFEKIEVTEVEEINENRDELTTQDVEQTTYKTYNDPDYVNYDEIYQGQGKLKTIDEQVEIEDLTKTRFSEPKIEEDINANYASRIRKLLHNKDSIKDAIILKEVLDRKYF